MSVRRLPALLILAALAACAGSPVFGGRGPTRETLLVQEQVMRWMIQYYQPSEFLGQAEAYCVVAADAGGVQWRSLTMVERPAEHDPPPGLMSRFRSASPPVHPISACRRDSELVERVAATGERAVIVGVGYPTWVTPSLARLRAVVLESANVRLTYGCSIERGREGWAVRNCVRRL